MNNRTILINRAGIHNWANYSEPMPDAQFDALMNALVALPNVAETKCGWKCPDDDMCRWAEEEAGDSENPYVDPCWEVFEPILIQAYEGLGQ
jgi:hypothetical protein